MGNTRRSTKPPGDRLQRLGLPNPRHISQRFKSRMNKKRQKVAKLIEKFESHKYKEQFLQDMSQTQKINRFNEASPKLPKDMNQTEIFEQEVGIIYCRSGRNLKHNRSPKPNLDCNSIGGYIKRKNCSRGPKRGPTKKARTVLQSKGHVAESKEERFSDNSRNMTRTRKLHNFIEGPRYW